MEGTCVHTSAAAQCYCRKTPTVAVITPTTAALYIVLPLLPCALCSHHCNRLLPPLSAAVPQATPPDSDCCCHHSDHCRLVHCSTTAAVCCNRTAARHCCLRRSLLLCYRPPSPLPPTFTQNRVSRTRNRCSYVCENRSEYN